MNVKWDLSTVLTIPLDSSGVYFFANSRFIEGRRITQGSYSCILTHVVSVKFMNAFPNVRTHVGRWLRSLPHKGHTWVVEKGEFNYNFTSYFEGKGFIIYYYFLYGRIDFLTWVSAGVKFTVMLLLSGVTARSRHCRAVICSQPEVATVLYQFYYSRIIVLAK